MFSRVVKVIIDAINHVKCANNRCGNNDFFDALVEINLKFFGSAKLAGAFQNDITARPVGFSDGLVGGVGDGGIVDNDC